MKCLDELKPLARELNRASDQLREEIREIERGLNGLGVEEWITKEGVCLGYIRSRKGQGWIFVVGWEDRSPLLSSDRETIIGACPIIPYLLERLLEKAKRLLSEMKENLKCA